MPLSAFHPAVQSWLEQRFGAPTAVQAGAWPAIASGSHTLLAAPTGSGKTLAAFLAAIDDLELLGECEPELAWQAKMLLAKKRRPASFMPPPPGRL